MKKQILSSLIAFSIIFTPTLRADVAVPYTAATEEISQLNDSDAPGSSLDLTAPLAVEPATEDLSEEEGASVQKASTDKMTAAKKKQWTNIIIAVVAVAIAVTALILVNSNQGHKS